jgi:GNAT superfamily N-acetyltransferase
VGTIRPCRHDERDAIFEIVNAAAEAYHGVIPADRWHEPYMALDDLDGEIARGVAFWGYEAEGALVGIMGMQQVGEVDLIRHAYVSPGSQRQGVGGALLERLARSTTRRMLVGTWAAADWAVRFYRHHGFELVSPERTAALLRTYWTIPDRQIETSVVLANPPLDEVRGRGSSSGPRMPAVAEPMRSRACRLVAPAFQVVRGTVPNPQEVQDHDVPSDP